MASSGLKNHAGFLYIKSPQDQNWNRQYCELNGNNLEYYEDPKASDSPKRNGTICILKSLIGEEPRLWFFTRHPRIQTSFARIFGPTAKILFKYSNLVHMIPHIQIFISHKVIIVLRFW